VDFRDVLIFFSCVGWYFGPYFTVLNTVDSDSDQQTPSSHMQKITGGEKQLVV
jgi:hypothetical protein